MAPDYFNGLQTIVTMYETMGWECCSYAHSFHEWIEKFMEKNSKYAAYEFKLRVWHLATYGAPSDVRLHD
jgi:hypothetical protein